MKHSVFIILLILISQFKANSSFQIDQKQQNLLNNSSVNKVISFENINKCTNTGIIELLPVIRDNKTKELQSFSGEVYMGDNLLPEGRIFIIENIKESYITHGSYAIQNGTFEFSELKSGSYILYAIPNINYDFFYYPKYFPTYSGNSYKWENSVEKDLINNLFNFTIHLQSYSDPFYGHEKVSGKISYQEDYRGGKDIPVPVFLLNQLKEPMDFRIADPETGEFAFNYLPAGTYYLHPEIIGIKSEDYKVKVEQENSSSHDVNFYINNENITTESIKDDEIENVISGKYLKLFLDEDINFPVICELINMSGSSVNKNIYYSNEVNINTTSISGGIYILRVRTYDNSIVKTKKVYINNYN